LPGAEGWKFCKRLKGLETTKSMKIMVLYGRRDPDNSVTGKDFGVDDCMLKPVDTNEFRARIKVLLETKTEAERLMGRPQASVCESIIDRQSGLYDRSYFSYQLDLEIKRSLRRKYCLTLIMIQVGLCAMDEGKYGRLTMGEIMTQNGKLLKGCILDEDLATYFRDGVFTLALPYLERDSAVNIAKRIQKAIISQNVFAQEVLHSPAVTASFGIAFCPYDACTAEELIRRAEAALGRAKRECKDGICKWEEHPLLRSEGD
jgi:two-component system cell cycle response regulator